MDKQLLVYSYNGMQLNNKKKYNTKIRNNIKRYVCVAKEARHKKVHNIWLNLYEVQERARLRLLCVREIDNGCPWGGGVIDYKRAGAVFRGDSHILFLIWVRVTQCKHLPTLIELSM